MKQGDTLPNLPFQLFEPDKVTPLNVSAASVINLVVRQRNAVNPIFKKPVTMTDPATGVGHYDWQAGDTDVTGTFDYEFEITWNTGDIQSIPADTYFQLNIVDDLG